MSGMHSGSQVRFLCDQNLGKLAKWLRLLGFDTDYMSRWDDAIVKQAVAEGRTVLTRKATLSGKRGVVLIRPDHVMDQIRELFYILDIKRCESPFSRCCICNAVVEDVPAEGIKGLVPDYVFDTHDFFARCPSCARIYWKGTHSSKMTDIIKHIMKDEA